MENTSAILAGLIGSVITLLLTATIDYFKEGYRAKMERERLLYQRKTDAAEKAMSWLQEAIDCYRMFQVAFVELNELYNPVTWKKLVSSSEQAKRLYNETSSKLNPVYLYYDFSDIERKYNILGSYYHINYAFTEIGSLNEQALALADQGVDEDSEQVASLRKSVFFLFKELSKEFAVQIMAIAEMQKELRKGYYKKSKN